MKRHLTKLILAAVLLVLFPGRAFSQYFNTIYWLQGIPQASYSNPALMPQPRFYLGMPGLSSIYAGAGHSGFALRDFLRKDAMDNFYWDEDNMLDRLGRRNIFDVDAQVDILAFGFRANRSYLSFNITEKVRARVAYPEDLMVLLLKGNDHFRVEGRPGDFAGLGLDAVHYREFGMSYARGFGDRITAGLRLKALQGMGGVWFERNNISLVTDPENYNLLVNADLLVNIATPSSLQPIDSLGSDFQFEVDPFDYLTNTKNIGGAIDLGFTFKPVERLTLAFSAIDLGLIGWKSGTENFAMKGEFEFQGIDMADFFREDNQATRNLLDSIKDIFDIQESTNHFRTMLPMKFYLSAGYDLSPRHKIALLGMAELYNARWHPSFTFSYNVKPIHAFSLALSYSVIHRNFHNVGAGFNLNMGPLQFYLVGNNFFGAVKPHAVQTANFHLGMNWVFGYRPKKEEMAPSITW